ncbi:MAG TPA: xanthine dehydrogenase family protein molybdopterin-binding subunit [Bacillota bacterium]|nr:xanthine dehydrogenase family protein molybdopterin-binding subunit [Bacillota bacterium]
MESIGASIPRKEAPDKVTGTVKYNYDYSSPDLLHGWLVTSLYAHAGIKSIDTYEALKIPGVQAVVTGEYFPTMVGVLLSDRPPLATGKVRYFGEPIAVVVANSEAEARRAADLVKVEYEPLPVVNSVGDALLGSAPKVHEQLGSYTIIEKTIYPESGTNIAHRQQIRKGDMQKGWAESDVIIEGNYKLPQSDHAAMETRSVRAEIRQDGTVIIHSTSQAPFMIKTVISRSFQVDVGKIVVHTPLVGGAYGGKTSVHLEPIAYLAAKAVGGRPVMLANTREQDMASSPSQIGVEARIKLGATKSGKLKAAEMTFLLDSGAYTDSGPIMAKAIAANCTGPYHIDNLMCDSLCVYTNHIFVTAFRGFGHTAYTFAMERAMEKLAFAVGMDPLEFRLNNILVPGDLSPTQVRITLSNFGDLGKCLLRLKELSQWDDGSRIVIDKHKVRAKGLSCFWKTSSSPTDAISGAILILNADGTINLMCGAVECGQGTKTAVAQILAEKMKMRTDQIYVTMEVDTRQNPDHWKTVASMSTYMVGRAVLEAADDVIRQIKEVAAAALRCPTEDLEVAEGRVYLRDDPEVYIELKDLAHGYKYENGNGIGGQIIGRGNFIMRHLSSLDKETGQGKPGPGWTVGAQAVEVEFDTEDYNYRILKAITVVDAGKVISPKGARGMITGAMSMGLGYGSREDLLYSDTGILQNPQFRSYKPLRYGEVNDFTVEFIETPELDAPYGERGLGEEGILGMPAALANALSTAAQVELNELPLVPERIWKASQNK